MAKVKSSFRGKSDEIKKASFAFLNLETISDRLASINVSAIEYLDLTENRFNDLRFLIDFIKLQTLIVDKNLCASHVKIPPLPSLHTLWINENQITNLSVFIGALTRSCPQLKYLSMMKNPAAPSFFNGGSYKDYVDYRYFVISQLKHLIMLDDRQISLEERQQAERIYPPVSLTYREKDLTRASSTRSS